MATKETKTTTTPLSPVIFYESPLSFNDMVVVEALPPQDGSTKASTHLKDSKHGSGFQIPKGIHSWRVTEGAGGDGNNSKWD